MKNIDRLKKIVDDTKAHIYELPYNENDVRKAYFENLYSILNHFYLGKVFFEISKQIKDGKIKFDSDIIDLKPHILRVYEIADHHFLVNSYHNELNRKIFVDTFTNFEVTIDLCFSELKNDNAIKKIVSDTNNKLLKLTKNHLNSEEIFELLIKNTFIPLIRKFKFLAKFKANCCGENYNYDVKFIEFCSKLRNCVLHSGGFYKGSDFEYEFDKVRFIFKDNEFLEMTGENNYVFIKLNERITNIIIRVFECIKEVDYIKYPDDGF